MLNMWLTLEIIPENTLIAMTDVSGLLQISTQQGGWLIAVRRPGQAQYNGCLICLCQQDAQPCQSCDYSKPLKTLLQDKRRGSYLRISKHRRECLGGPLHHFC